MADYRDDRYPGRGESRGCGYEEEDRRRRQREREQDRAFGGCGRGSSRDRMGSEQFRPDEPGPLAERNYRDFGRGQPGGPYEHAGYREYRHGSGYGGFGEAPGESGGGFDSGRSYAAEPGWGPGYGGGPQRGHGRGPKGYHRSDERLKEEICERLMAAAYIDAAEVSVEVQDGKVTLVGTVPERRMKHRIEDVVDECMGVEDIDNRIRVGASRPEPTLVGASGIAGQATGQDAGSTGSDDSGG